MPWSVYNVGSSPRVLLKNGPIHLAMGFSSCTSQWGLSLGWGARYCLLTSPDSFMWLSTWLWADIQHQLGLRCFLVGEKESDWGISGQPSSSGDQQSRKRDGFSPGRQVQLDSHFPQVSWGGLSTQVGRVSPPSACLG